MYLDRNDWWLLLQVSDHAKALSGKIKAQSPGITYPFMPATLADVSLASSKAVHQLLLPSCSNSQAAWLLPSMVAYIKFLLQTQLASLNDCNQLIGWLIDLEPAATTGEDIADSASSCRNRHHDSPGLPSLARLRPQ